MPGAQPQQTDVLPVNGWIMEIDGGALNSPHFHKVSGLSRKTGTMEVVDGGTNIKLFFSDGILEHGPITITRARDGSADDQTFANFIRDTFANGKKRTGTLVQYRHGKQVLEIKFKGMLMNEYNMNDLDTHGADKAEQSYHCHVDFWEDRHS